MKSEVKTYFTCALCGRTSQNQEKIKACEESHIVLGGEHEIVKQTFKRSGINTKYPEELVFVLEDGTEVAYGHAWTHEQKAGEEPT
jgi:hypothetical protein